MAHLLRLIALAALLCIAPAAHAQLNGVYTCANGNPGNTFNYGDIGAFFNALETQGMSGPVTLNVFDDGGAWAKASTTDAAGGFCNFGRVRDVVLVCSYEASADLVRRGGPAAAGGGDRVPHE